MEDDEPEIRVRPSGLVPIIIIPTDEDWIVVLISFCQNFLKESIPLTFLVLASANHPIGCISSEERYIIGSCFLGLYHILTPISCAMINWYSFKTISILGPTVSIVVMVACYFVQDRFDLSFFFLSLVGGLGFSMINATSLCMPPAWFCNRRGLACHISGLGLGIGVFTVPFFTRSVFLETLEFPITETYLFYAGLYIPLVAMGFLVPKLHGVILHVLNSRKPTAVRTVKFMDQEFAADMARTMSILGKETATYFIFRTFHNLFFPRVKDIIKERSVFMVVPDEAMMRVVETPWRSYGPRMLARNVSAPNQSVLSFDVLGVQEIHIVTNTAILSFGARPFYRVDIFFTSNINLLNLYYRQTNQLDYHMAATRAISRKDYNQEINNECPVFPEAISRTILTMLHIGLWKHCYFVVLQLVIFLLYVGHFIPFTFIKDRGEELGLSESNSFRLVSFIGCGNIVGRAFALIVTIICFDVDLDFFFELTLVCNGLFTVASNYFPFFEIQATYCFITGVCMGLASFVKVGCIFRLMGIFNLTNAMGYQFLSQGAGIMTGLLLTGTGTSFIVMVSSVATGFWFESKRTLAMGIGSSARGFSVFTIYLTDYVSKTYGWKWCFVVWAGMTIILCICSFLLAMPPMFELETDLSQSSIVEEEEEELNVSKITSMALDYEISNVKKMSERKVREMTIFTGIPLKDTCRRRSKSSVLMTVGLGKWCPFCLCCDWCQQAVGSRPLYRKDIFYEGNLEHAAKVEHKNKETFALSMVMLPTTKDVMEEVECPIRVPEAVTRAVSNMIDFSLFESPFFLLIMVSSVLIYSVRYIPFLSIKRMNIEHMNEDRATSVVSMMGLGSLLSRGLIGVFFYNYKNINALSASIFTTIVGGMVLCCIPLNHWYPYQLCMSFFGGALPSVIGTLRNIVIIDFMGLAKLTSSTGVLFFIQGLASFAGLPIAELLNTETETTYAGMVYTGVCYIIAGLLFSVISFFPKYEGTGMHRGSSILWDSMRSLK